MAQEMGILPCINEHRGPLDAAEIAQKINSDALLVCKNVLSNLTWPTLLIAHAARIMRALTSVGIATETAPNIYQANAISQIAASQGGKAGIKYLNELLFAVGAQIVPYMREHGFKQFPQRPEEVDPTQFTFDGRVMWDYLKDTPEMKNWFDTLVIILTDSSAVLTVFLQAHERESKGKQTMVHHLPIRK